MKFDWDKVHVAIISHNRHKNIKKMEELTGIGEKITWYVGVGEAQKYAGVKGKVIEGGKLIPSRNKALDDAFAEDNYCCMIEDDMKKLEIVSGGSVNNITFQQAINEMYRVLKDIPLHLAGAAPTPNPFFFNPNKPLGLKHFILGSLILVKPTPLRFDTGLSLKEDYDFTLQHIQKYGGVCRLNYILPSFQHYSNKGGAVNYRTDTLEQETIKYLKQKWKNSIRDNPRRKNEILLHIK